LLLLILKRKNKIVIKNVINIIRFWIVEQKDIKIESINTLDDFNILKLLMILQQNRSKLKFLIFRIQNYIKTLPRFKFLNLHKKKFSVYSNVNVRNAESKMFNSFENLVFTLEIPIKQLQIKKPLILNGFAIKIDLNRFEVLVNLTSMILKSLYYLNNTVQVKLKLFKFFSQY
jgi:hypothetical protein